ncbi:MAG: hypothetical protein AABZ53_09655 [Planctomycetota bacterium]
MTHAITSDDLFNAWSKHPGDPCALADHLKLTPAQLSDLTDNPAFVRRIAAWERLTRVYKEDLVFDHQQAAAATLRETMAASDPIEARRAATTLVRLCRNMLPRGTALQSSASRSRFAQAGTALQSGASDCPSPPQSAAPSAPSTPPSAPSQPSTPPDPVDAPLTLPLVTPSPQVVTKLTARAGAAARASGP